MLVLCNSGSIEVDDELFIEYSGLFQSYSEDEDLFEEVEPLDLSNFSCDTILTAQEYLALVSIPFRNIEGYIDPSSLSKLIGNNSEIKFVKNLSTDELIKLINFFDFINSDRVYVLLAILADRINSESLYEGNIMNYFKNESLNESLLEYLIVHFLDASEVESLVHNFYLEGYEPYYLLAYAHEDPFFDRRRFSDIYPDLNSIVLSALERRDERFLNKLNRSDINSAIGYFIKIDSSAFVNLLFDYISEGYTLPVFVVGSLVGLYNTLTMRSIPIFSSKDEQIEIEFAIFLLRLNPGDKVIKTIFNRVKRTSLLLSMYCGIKK